MSQVCNAYSNNRRPATVETSRSRLRSCTEARRARQVCVGDIYSYGFQHQPVFWLVVPHSMDSPYRRRAVVALLLGPHPDLEIHFRATTKVPERSHAPPGQWLAEAVFKPFEVRTTLRVALLTPERFYPGRCFGST
jgi:hypothetical protein